MLASERCRRVLLAEGYRKRPAPWLNQQSSREIVSGADRNCVEPLAKAIDDERRGLNVHLYVLQVRMVQNLRDSFPRGPFQRQLSGQREAKTSRRQVQRLAGTRRYNDRKSTLLNCSHLITSYAVFC